MTKIESAWDGRPRSEGAWNGKWVDEAHHRELEKTQAQKNVIEKSIERHKRHEIKGKISDIKNQIKDTNRAGYFYKNNKALSYRPYSNRFVKDAFTSKAKDISRNEVKNLIRKSLNK